MNNQEFQNVYKISYHIQNKLLKGNFIGQISHTTRQQILQLRILNDLRCRLNGNVFINTKIFLFYQSLINKIKIQRKDQYVLIVQYGGSQNIIINEELEKLSNQVQAVRKQQITEIQQFTRYLCKLKENLIKVIDIIIVNSYQQKDELNQNKQESIDEKQIYLEIERINKINNNYQIKLENTVLIIKQISNIIKKETDNLKVVLDETQNLKILIQNQLRKYSQILKNQEMNQLMRRIFLKEGYIINKFKNFIKNNGVLHQHLIDKDQLWQVQLKKMLKYGILTKDNQKTQE